MLIRYTLSECVSKIKSILSVVIYAIYGAVCIPLTHLSYDDCEHTCTLYYYHHQIGSMTHLPLFRVRSWNRVRQNGTANWWVGCKKQVSRTGTSNYIPQHLWDVITCPCPWYLPLAHRSMIIIAWIWMTKSFYECIFKLLIMYMLWWTDDISESVIPTTLFPIFTGLWHVLIQLNWCDLIYYHIYAYTFSPPG